MNKIPMTIRGAEKLREELYQLKNVKRPLIIASIAKAREHGDLKENSEYHAAREEQCFCEGRIKDLENKLSNSQIIDVTNIPNKGTVIFGATVTVLKLNTYEKITYCIVGEDEADLTKNLISITSPIARGLVGKAVEDTSIVKTPSGKIEYEILKVEYI